MNNMTKLGLMDDCINGSKDNFDALFGVMFDQFSCFFALLKENGVKEVPKQVSFNKNLDIAEFEVSANISSESTESLGIFDCKITVKPSSTKQTTKVQVTRNSGRK